MIARAALGALGIALCAPPGAAQSADGEWSRFRGPNGTGVVDVSALPDHFDAEHRRWRTPLGLGHSSPVLAGRLVYVTGEEPEEGGEGRTLVTYAIDRDSGEIAWRSTAPRPRRTRVDKRNNAASPTPAVAGDVVVVFFPDFGMLAYDRNTGAERWQRPLGPFDNEYGMGASPIIDGQRVFLPCDHNRGSFLIAVGLADGEELWRVDRPSARSGHCTPVLFDAEDGSRQLILPGSFYLDAYDVTDGERVWWVHGLSVEMKSVPVLADGVIYINGYASPLNQPGNQVVLPPFETVIAERDADGDGAIDKDEMPPSRATAYFPFFDLDRSGALEEEDWAFARDALASQNGMLAIRAGGEGDRTESQLLWGYRRSVPQLPSPLLYQGVLYLLQDQGGLVLTLDPKTGASPTRARLERALDAYYASPVAGDDKVYLLSESGILTVLPAGGSLEPTATFELGEACYATPALAEGCAFLRTTEALHRYDAR